ncbi:transglutaminase family protein [Paenibacillus sp. NPDC056579]|uniref:transglutaminase-like domain-containing protein n=1 Tax=Paenibacillus sp. NPDC056579 TaxID=3345871 RepID=UPI0036AE0276
MAKKPTVPPPAHKLPAEPEQPWPLRIGYALLLFWLIRAWLVPLQQLSDVTEVYRIAPFLGAFAFFLAVGMFRMPGSAAWPLRAAAILAVTAVLHSGNWLPEAGWWASWLRELSSDALHALSGQFGYISSATRTMLFLTGWCFFIWVLQSFVADRMQLLWFVIMTMLYLIALQIVFDTDMSASLLGAVGAGLLLQGWLQAERWLRWKQAVAGYSEDVSAGTNGAVAGGASRVTASAHSAGAEQAGLWKRIASSCIVTAMLVICAWMGAQLHPTEGKTVEWSGSLAPWERLFDGAEHIGERAALASLSAGRTGYSTDDSHLGSPLTQDDAVAFIAKTTRLTYWRGESKSTYTGQGWQQTVSEPVLAVPDTKPDTKQAAELDGNRAGMDNEGFVPASVPPEEPHIGIVTQQVYLKQPFRQLFVGGSLHEVESLVSETGKLVSPDWVWKDMKTDRYFLPALADPLASYAVQVTVLDQEGRRSAAPGTETGLPGDEYIQLPNRLPDRVAELARTVTANASTAYDKAQAVETYLKTHYTYDLDRTKPPAGGQDFVDQFLFEQRMGYCDHFSTAMTVMLRTVGVHTRWVKGFAPGQVVSAEPAESGRDTLYQVEVRNQDAHSWVEVFIPSTGWIAFDPTPGYNGSANKEAAAAASAASAETPDDGWDLSSIYNSLKSSMNRFILMALHTAAFLSTLASAGLAVLHKGALWIAPYLPLSLWIAAAALTAAGAWLLIKLQLKRGGSREKIHFASGSQAHISRLFGLERMRSHAVHRLAERQWSKLQRRFGRAEPAQTMREYLLTRSNATEEQRQSLLRFVRLREALKYHGGSAAVTSRQLYEAWADIRKSL